MNIAVYKFRTGFCLPKFLSVPFSAPWLTFSRQSFQESVGFGGGRETVFDKYFHNSEMKNNLT